jgi:hypothetical protein
LEHGTVNQTTNVTGDDPLLTGKIALAHLTEFPDYYTRLAKMEAEAKNFLNSKKHHTISNRIVPAEVTLPASRWA